MKIFKFIACIFSLKETKTFSYIISVFNIDSLETEFEFSIQKTDNKTHEETKDINFEKKKKEIESDPIISEVKQLFPNAEIKDIE